MIDTLGSSEKHSPPSPQLRNPNSGEVSPNVHSSARCPSERSSRCVSRSLPQVLIDTERLFGSEQNPLMSRYAVCSSSGGEQVAQPSAVQVTDEKGKVARLPHDSSGAHLRMKQSKRVNRRKIVLLGQQEVGKTSLRLCFESDPWFFKDLPEVRTTSGVDIQRHVDVHDTNVHVTISDFAGQETYHSHTFFLTDRSVIALVWKLSSIEQGHLSRGIEEGEELRLQGWITEVYSKFPNTKLVLIGTHLDELRQRDDASVESVLMKVEGRIDQFLSAIKAKSFLKGRDCRGSMSVVGSFAVSCKKRSVVCPRKYQSAMTQRKMSSLLHFMVEVARRDCQDDPEFPNSSIPGHLDAFINRIQKLQKDNTNRLLIPIGEFVMMASDEGIQTDAELLQVARLMHSWDDIYVLHPYSIESNEFIVLQPQWLRRIAAALFSFAHVLQTPLHLRNSIKGLEYMISAAEEADMSLMKKGVLRLPLARVLFSKAIKDSFGVKVTDYDINMCLGMLQSMEAICPIEVRPDDEHIIAEETLSMELTDPSQPPKRTVRRYFVPSLSPYDTPLELRRIVPLLFHRGRRQRMTFNLLPDELWWRLQCKLHSIVWVVAVYQPESSVVLDVAAAGMGNDWTVDDLRLREADDENSRWRDSLWLGASTEARVLMIREGASTISIFSAEVSAGTADSILEKLEDAVSLLLCEYGGVQRKIESSCCRPDCTGWIQEGSDGVLSCSQCNEKMHDHKNHGSKCVVHFSTTLMDEVRGLLTACVASVFLPGILDFLGINSNTHQQHQSTALDAGVEQVSRMKMPDEFIHALDKVIQVILFRSSKRRLEMWHERHAFQSS